VTLDLPDVLTSDDIDRTFLKQAEPEWETLATCIQCGTCTTSCPANESMDYSPRQVWEMMRLGLQDVVTTSRTYWLCTQCYACQVRCPRGIEIADTMRNLREWAVARDEHVPQALRGMQSAVGNSHNILAEDNQSRLIWSENLAPIPEQLREVGKSGTEVLFFTGCVSAFYPQAYSIPQAFIQILEKAGVSYTTMGGEEWCCGFPLYTAGMKDDVAELAKHNVAHARSIGAQFLVATCPACYLTWSHIYPEFVDMDGIDFEILHSSQFLVRLIEQGRITFARDLPMTVTYHDPCDLGRKAGVYEAPRSVIKSIPGVTLREMANSRENAVCCGGGGDVAMSDPKVTEGMANRRIAEAKSTKATAVVSACQQCKRTLQQAARTTRTRMRVLDVTELLLQALGD